MFGGRKKNSEFPIGLDVGDQSVRMLQLSLRGGKVHAIAAASAPLRAGVKPGSGEYEAALSEAIRAAVGRGAFVGNRVVSSMPTSAVLCKNLRLPMMPADELDSAVQWEAADRFRMGKDQCSVQYMHAGQVSQGDEVRQELILLAANLKQVESHVAAVTDCGFKPVAIDSVPTALSRLATLRENTGVEALDGGGVSVTIDVGHSSTKVLITLDGQVRFFKPIEIGGGTFDSVLSGALSISLEEAYQLRRNLGSVSEDGEGLDMGPGAPSRVTVVEALDSTLGELAREIGLCLRYYGVTFRGARPSEAQLVGGAAAPWLVEALGESSGLSLSLDAPLGEVDCSGCREVIRPGSEGAWAVAAGLSIREHMKYFTASPAEAAAEADSVFGTGTDAKGVAA